MGIFKAGDHVRVKRPVDTSESPCWISTMDGMDGEIYKVLADVKTWEDVVHVEGSSWNLNPKWCTFVGSFGTVKSVEALKAEIEEAERELKKKREEFVRLTEIREGDYVEAITYDGVIVGRLEAIGSNCFDGTVYKVKTWSDKKTFTLKSIKKWQPKKGDLCIFWDSMYKYYSHIDIFSVFENGTHTARGDVYFDNCIPFISEQQFKEHIGYEG